MTESFTAYTKPLHVAHAGVRFLVTDSQNLMYQEKLDGSQLSFGITNDGSIFIRSKGRVFDINAPDGMFERAASSVRERAHLLTPGWTYRGEYLRKPKHNVLAYNRVPEGNIAIFDIAIGLHDYLDDPKAVESEAHRIGLDYCPVFFRGPYSVQKLDELLERESFLGGPRIEGVVLKDHAGGYFGRDAKPLMAKYVSPDFKEIHQQAFKPAKDFSVQGIANEVAKTVCTEARWRKAVQHLREDGRLKEEPADIGPLIKELQDDINAECAELMKEMLMSRFRKDIMKCATRGFPEWYKKQLMEGLL